MDDIQLWMQKENTYREKFSSKNTWDQIWESTTQYSWSTSVWFTHATHVVSNSRSTHNRGAHSKMVYKHQHHLCFVPSHYENPKSFIFLLWVRGLGLVPTYERFDG